MLNRTFLAAIAALVITTGANANSPFIGEMQTNGIATQINCLNVDHFEVNGLAPPNQSTVIHFGSSVTTVVGDQTAELENCAGQTSVRRQHHD